MLLSVTAIVALTMAVPVPWVVPGIACPWPSEDQSHVKSATTPSKIYPSIFPRRWMIPLLQGSKAARFAIRPSPLRIELVAPQAVSQPVRIQIAEMYGDEYDRNLGRR